MKLCLLLLFLLVSHQAAPVLTIDSSGVVEVDLRAAVVEGLNEVALPVEPLPETIEVKVDGKALIPIYENGSLYFLSPSSGEAEITYLANITAADGGFKFRVEGSDAVDLILDPNVILLTVPERIENLTYLDGRLLIRFRAPEEIAYAIRRETATQTKAETSETTPAKTAAPPPATETVKTATMTTSLASSTKTEATSKTAPTTLTKPPPARAETSKSVTEALGATESQPSYGTLIFGLGVIAVGVLLGLMLYKNRRGGGFEESRLSELDRLILKAIRESGGSILQGRLQNELGIPKTTLWRHVKKLEKQGYLRIVKEGSVNRLILLREAG